jgi:hypothetical protein
MRCRSALLLPLVLFGCAPGRQAAVSSDGRVASTVATGTFLTGRGRVAESGSDLAWSPDGQTLAIAAKDGVLFWPQGTRIAGMSGRLAWSSDGTKLAGIVADKVAVWDMTTQKLREVPTDGVPSEIRWMPDGQILGVDESGFQVEGHDKVVRGGVTLFDAAPQADGTVVWLEAGSTAKRSDHLQAQLRLGQWNPVTKSVTATKIATVGTLLGAASARRLMIPTRFALAPGGGRYAVAGIVIEAGTRGLTRLKAIADKPNPTKVEQDEYERLLKAARKRSVVFHMSFSGQRESLWSETVPTVFDGPSDLAWSPNGQWLAIARKNGTVRVAAGG